MAIAIDTETTGLFIHKGCRPFVISAADDKHKTFIWEFKVDPFTREVQYNEQLDHFRETIAKHDELVFHNANFDVQALVAIGFDLETLFSDHEIHDTMLMSHAYKSHGPHGLKELGITILDYPADDETRLGDITKAARTEAAKLGWCIADKNNPHPSLIGISKEWHKSDYWIPKQISQHLGLNNREWETICNEYAEKDVIRTMGLWTMFPVLMNQQQLDSYYNNRRTILSILRMEYEGVTTLGKEFSEAKVIYQDKCGVGQARMERISRFRGFNPDSPKHLKSVLFGKYGFKTDKTTNTGAVSTNKEVIAELMDSCPVGGELPERYVFLKEYTTWRKAKTTLGYINNYLAHGRRYKSKTDPQEGPGCLILTPNFKQTGTDSGRLSCENPNLTNVGKRDMGNPFANSKDDSFKIRNIFGPLPGYKWTCIDYTQSQILIFAIVSGSDKLVDDYINGIDLHDAVARTIFKTDDISSVQRTAAKAINFGILFGAGPAKIDQQAGIPGLYGQFLKQLPGAKRYLASQEKLARDLGFVHTLGGYRLYVPKDRPYAASCYVIQGTEAEIVKMAMADVSDYCYNTQWFLDNYKEIYTNPAMPLYELERPKGSCSYRMIMMVHDELVFNHKTISNIHTRNLMRLMSNAGRAIGVPVRVDAEIVHHNWADKAPLDISI